MMDSFTTIPTVAHVIQQALTPVFLLGGVGAILNVLTGRLARTVDRFRLLSETENAETNEYLEELSTLPRRVRLTYLAIRLCTLCGLFICISIVTLFVGAELELNLTRIISILFIAAMIAMTFCFFTFLREISLATVIINSKLSKHLTNAVFTK